MQEELILIDKLEDQLIDHPDAGTKDGMDGSQDLDETFQRKLNARAEQLASESGSPTDLPLLLINKTRLKYDYKDHQELDQELDEWFVRYDFKELNLLSLAQIYTDKTRDVDEDGEIECLSLCIDEMNTTEFEFPSKAVDVCLYYTMGKFKLCSDKNDQLSLIRNNLKVLHSLGIVETVCGCIQRILNSEMSDEETDFSPVKSINLFKLLTIMYFMVNSLIDCNDGKEFLQVREILDDLDLMSTIVSFIQYWKVWPNSRYRIRHCILLLWKLVLFEFGDSNMLTSCDKLLIKHFGIHNKQDDSSTKLTCSPLDYYTFREDLIDKYPLFNDSILKRDAYDFKQFGKTLDEENGLSRSSSISSASSSVQEDYDYFMALNNHSYSLSNYIANPRPNKAHTIQSQLPAQTVHLSTPVPSPPSTPSDFMSGGEKVRKLYQINQSMPFIYPTDMGVKVPYAVQEANEILENSVYESYSNKRLWQERQKFMIQERGYVNNYDSQAQEEFPHYPNRKIEVKSMERVEKFYGRNLDKFSNLIEVLIGTLQAHKIEHNLAFIETELNGSTSYYQNDQELTKNEKKKQIDEILIQQLEVIRTKEITAKASSSILILFLKWFKISHVVKYYYFSTLLFDQQICKVVMDVLTETFNNPNLQDTSSKTEKENEYEKALYQNQLLNPQIKLNQFKFFNECMRQSKTGRFHLINRKKLTEFRCERDPQKVNHYTIDEFNHNHCMLMVNLVNVLNKVIIKNYTQRILTLNDLKPSETFKMLLLNYPNNCLSKPILKILKKLVPFQGRKWKIANMDMISQIFLNCRLGLRDNWLSGRDLENEFNNSFDQEISLRGLCQFYNMRNYPETMVHLGYQLSLEFSFSLEDNLE